MSSINKPLGVGIVGCGLIGQKRAKALGESGQLVACADLNVARAESLARINSAKVFLDWRELVGRQCWMWSSCQRCMTP